MGRQAARSPYVGLTTVGYGGRGSPPDPRAQYSERGAPSQLRPPTVHVKACETAVGAKRRGAKHRPYGLPTLVLDGSLRAHSERDSESACAVLPDAVVRPHGSVRTVLRVLGSEG